MKIRVAVSRKLELDLPYDLFSFWVYAPKDSTSYYRDTCSSMMIAAVFTIARTRKYGYILIT